jgi:hypothetical protein
VAIAVLVAVGLYLAPYLSGPGAELDEGSLLAYPVRVLHGAWPHRDFEMFYGPGSPVMLAAAYEVFGATVGLERAIGLIIGLVAVLSIFLLARPAGSPTAALCALLMGGMVPSIAVTPSAALSALAFDLLALALLARTRASGRGQAMALASGLAAGAGVLFRPDFAVATVLAALPLLAAVGARERWRWLSGAAVGVILVGAHAAVVGPARVERVVGDVLRSGPGRRVPLPVLASVNGLLMILSALGIILLAGLLRSGVRRREPEIARLGLTGALFAVGLVPYFLSRAGLGHIIPLASVAIGLLPVALLAHARVDVPRLERRVRGLVGPVAAAVGLGLAVLGTIGLAAGERPAELTGRFSRHAIDVHYGGRTFPLNASVASQVQAMLDAVPRFSRPGARLFVGERDLRQANYSDTFLYYLLDKLVPASYYMELNPQTANHGTLLAHELRRADILILTSRYDVQNPTGQLIGNTNAPQVVARLFCPRVSSGTYMLLTRCH